jgi:alpha-tubulin suppressor-like RCC1 family protein
MLYQAALLNDQLAWVKRSVGGFFAILFVSSLLIGGEAFAGDRGKITPIAAGYLHAFAIDNNGRLYAAGWNEYGQLGLGDKADRDKFTVVSALSGKRIIAAAVGFDYSFALDNSGKVYAAGRNDKGQLGLGDTIDRDLFTEVSALGDKNIVAIAVRFKHAIALTSDGAVYATGYNGYGQLGLGDSGWQTDRNVFTEVSSLNGKKIIAIAAGNQHSLALTSEGKVYATGNTNNYGKLGSNRSIYSNEFTEISSLKDKTIIAIAAGDFHSLALDSDGKVYAAGNNEIGQLGLGDSGWKTNREVFTEVSSFDGKTITAIAAGNEHSLALTNDGKLYATGNNIFGQLGLGSNGNYYDSFVEVSSFSGKKIALVTAGNFNSFVVANDDKVCATIEAFAKMFGAFVFGGGDKRIEAFAKIFGTLDLTSDAKLYASGNNYSGQLGLGDKTDRKAFTEVSSFSGKNIVAIAAPPENDLDKKVTPLVSGFRCFFAKAGGGKVCAAGWDNCVRQRVGDIDRRQLLVETVLLFKGIHITAVAAGKDYSLALDSDGVIYATGNNYSGKLGLSNTTDRKAFTELSPFSGKTITAIAAGKDYSLAVDSDGKVYAAGYNEYDLLGLGETTGRNVFAEISSFGGKTITDIAVEGNRFLALDSDGKVYATGYNIYGQLGLGDSGSINNRRAFTEVWSLKGKKIAAIVARGDSSFAITNDGKVYATGSNGYGKLGLDFYGIHEEFMKVKF